MPKVEIEEAELLASQEVVQAVNKMMANPKARSLLLHARKTSDPTASVPEIDSMVPVAGVLENFRKELKQEREERAKERQEEDERRRIESATREVEGVKARLKASGW